MSGWPPVVSRGEAMDGIYLSPLPDRVADLIFECIRYIPSFSVPCRNQIEVPEGLMNGVHTRLWRLDFRVHDRIVGNEGHEHRAVRRPHGTSHRNRKFL